MKKRGSGAAQQPSQQQQQAPQQRQPQQQQQQQQQRQQQRRPMHQLMKMGGNTQQGQPQPPSFRGSSRSIPPRQHPPRGGGRGRGGPLPGSYPGGGRGRGGQMPPRGPIVQPLMAVNNNNSYYKTPPAAAPAPVAPLKHKDELKALCRQLDLPEPEFKTSSIGSSKGKGPVRYMSTCVLSGSTSMRGQTYPVDYPSEALAEDAVAKIVIDMIQKQSGAVPKVPTNTESKKAAASPESASPDSSQSTSISSEQMEHIVDILGARLNGVWSTQIDVEYKQRFPGSPLPTDWPSLLASSTDTNHPIRVESSAIPGRFIVFPNSSSSTSQTQASQGEPKPEKSPSKEAQNGAVKDAPAPESDSSGQPISLPSLTLPSEPQWNVYVTRVVSTNECFMRLIGDEYSDKFDELVTEMELHYFNDSDKKSITEPEIGQLYVAKHEDEWHRVIVRSILQDENKVLCYFVDNGEEESVSVAKLKELHKDFCHMPAQVFAVKLYGLEGVQLDQSEQVELDNLVLGKALVGEVHWSSTDKKALDASNCSQVSMTLFNNHTDSDVNVNQALSRKLLGKDITPPPPPKSPPAEATAADTDNNNTKAAAPAAANDEDDGQTGPLLPDDLASLKELVSPAIPGVEEYLDVNVVFAASPTNFIVQPWDKIPELDEHQASLAKFYSSAKPPVTASVSLADIDNDRFYAACNKDTWYRVRVKDVIDPGHVSVRFVDYGNHEALPLSALRPLASQFRNFPMQAVKAKLADIVAVNVDWSPKDVDWFSERVFGKQFVSVIKGQGYDDADGWLEVTLSLIDTSHPTKDVYMEKELVERGMAVMLCL